jgi:hypothetical protein
MIDASVQRRLRIAAKRPTNPDVDVCLEAAEQITALQYALREALDGWETWSGCDLGLLPADEKRITELRQFLDDK